MGDDDGAIVLQVDRQFDIAFGQLTQKGSTNEAVSISIRVASAISGRRRFSAAASHHDFLGGDPSSDYVCHI